MDKKWIIILLIGIVLVITMSDTSVKKEGRWNFECSDDGREILFKRTATNKSTPFVVCSEDSECKETNEGIECVQKTRTEPSKKETNFNIGMLIASIVLIFIGYKFNQDTR